MQKYIPGEFEKKINAYWEKNQVHKTVSPDGKKEKIYALSMFPYPSGAGLHVGHVRIYTGTDVLARFFRMNQKAVMHPMGWDAFGLPAENAAIKAKKNPMDMVPDNIKNFKKQMSMLGLSYDWNRELSTIDPAYYRLTQWLFIQFFKMGLLYKKNTPVYFCEFCKTGLAEEEVLSDGTHERCGRPITRKELPQWIFRITSYADRLLNDLENLDWPDGILEMQKNWIGKKEGINIAYKVSNNDRSAIDEKITVFTTRPDTNFGATFIVLAPEHDFVKKIISGKIKTDDWIKKDLEEYVKKSLAKTDQERINERRKKTGAFTGFYAVNNLNNRLMPIWTSDFVLSEFGTGAVVGVPGHDVRDFEFAKTFGLDVIRVVVGKDGDKTPITKKEQVEEGEGTMINSGFLDGLGTQDATNKIMDFIEKKSWGKRVVTYHLRDWIFSRQRYWGEPIPMVFCKNCADQNISWWKTDEGIRFSKSHQNISKQDKNITKNMAGWFPLVEQSLPLELPYTKSYEPTGTGESPLTKIKGWVETKCPHCGASAKRETDTMPNWAGSCWYFLRFASQKINSKSQISNYKKNPNNKEQNLFGTWDLEFRASIKKWLPVDWYLGGAEHAVLHLLYSRFWVKAMQDLGLLDFSEPFLRLRNVGMVIAEDHRKMSKSFGNIINPDDVVLEYGADALRIYEMFMAPFNQEIAWSTTALQGAYRFLNRVWKIYHSFKFNPITSKIEDDKKKLIGKLNKTIQKVTDDIPQTKFNTAIAAMMEFLNDWERFNKPLASESLDVDEAKKFLQILAPFAPFITEEIWLNVFGEKNSIHLSNWPKSGDLVVEEELKIPVQVDGRLRSFVVLSRQDLSEKKIIESAVKDEKVSKFIGGKKYKAIYVKGKILNIVLAG